MKEENVNRILKEVEEEWNTRHGKQGWEESVLKHLKVALERCPYDDGCQRMASAETGKVHLVPVKTMILEGVNHNQLKNYPEESAKPSENIRGYHVDSILSDEAATYRISEDEDAENNEQDEKDEPKPE